MADVFFGLTDTGKQRNNNEDTFVAQTTADGKKIVAAVIDGVGGYAGGEVAAAIARDTIIAETQTTGKINDTLNKALLSANSNIIAEKPKNHLHDGMACVCTLVIADPENNEAHFAHVGDTRLYLFRDGSLVKLTNDHSFVGFLEDSGRLSETEAMKHPKRNEINKALGFEADIAEKGNYIELGSSPFLPGDILLLCSDGLTDMINKQDIISILSSGASLKESAYNLINLANHNGGADNVTVVLVANDRKPAAQTAIKPVEQKKRVDVKSEPVESVTPASTVPLQQQPVARKSPVLTILLFILLIAAAGYIYYQHQQLNNAVALNNGTPSTADTGATKPNPSPEQAALQHLLDSIKSDTIMLSDSVFKKPIVINSTLQISKDTLLLAAKGNVTLVADSSFMGPAISLSPNSKVVVLSHLNFSGFQTGVTSFDNALILKAVEFEKCSVPVQVTLTAPSGTPVTGWLPSTILRIDTAGRQNATHNQKP